MPLTKLSHALVTSSAWAREASVAWTMCAVAGSTTSRVAEAKTSRSTSYGASAAFSGASRAARTASVEAYSPSATVRRETMPVARSNSRCGRDTPEAAAIRSRSCRDVTCRSGRQEAAAVMPARRAGP